MRLRVPILAALTISCAFAQVPLTSDIGRGNNLSGWYVITPSYNVEWLNDCITSPGCAHLTPGPAVNGGSGVLMQMFDAEPYRGKIVRYRANVQVSNGRAQLWLRADLPDGGVGFFDNMQDRPVTPQRQERVVEIEGFIDPTATRVALGLIAIGDVRFNEPRIEVIGDLDVSQLQREQARPLTDSGLANLTALARLFGLVRFFHPSDEAAATHWNRLAIEAVRSVESAESPGALAERLHSVFAPAAPTLRVFVGEPPAAHVALSEPRAGARVTYWHHHGVQLSQAPLYRSERREAAGVLQPGDIFAADLGRGVGALVPLNLYRDVPGTLPYADAPAPQPRFPEALLSAEDRATRLADVILAWNVFEHFYPYFDVVETDWDAVLADSLRRAATDGGPAAFYETLLKMVAALHDGHGSVNWPARPFAVLPFMGAWIEEKYIVTVDEGELKRGDEIVAIDSRPVGTLLDEAETMISGATPQWIRFRAATDLMIAPPGTTATVTVRPFGASETREIAMTTRGTGRPRVRDNRPTRAIDQIEPGIWYVDLTRLSDQQYASRVRDLASAKGIVYDLRGYPSLGPQWLTNLSRTPMTSAQWHIPEIERPGEMEFSRGGEWNLQPTEPFLAAKKVFLTDGSAISYAESTMGIIEAYKLGEIVGETTAGTNGNTNPFPLPGGYTINWTGMKVLKHDGSQHHGVGISPTIPVQRTQAGVASGRDEALGRALLLFR